MVDFIGKLTGAAVVLGCFGLALWFMFWAWSGAVATIRPVMF